MCLWSHVSPSEVCHQYLPSVSDVEDLHRAVRGAGGEASSVIVHLGVVLKETDGRCVYISVCLGKTVS